MIRPFLRLRRTEFRPYRSDLGLHRPHLGLHRPGLSLTVPLLRIYRPDLGLTGPDLRLIWSDLLAVRLHELSGTSLVWLHRADLRAYRRHGVGDRTLNASIGNEWPGDRCHRRATFVLVEELLPVLRGLALVLQLGRHRGDLRSAHGDQFSRPWPDLDAAPATVIGDAGIAVIVDDDCPVIYVCDSVYIDPVDGAVVVEVVAAPITAVIAVAGVTAAVWNASVEADVQAPVTAIEAIAIAVKAPVAGGPESAGIGCRDPCAGNPVVAKGSVVPIAGSPDVVWIWCDGLHINRECRGRLVCLFDCLLA